MSKSQRGGESLELSAGPLGTLAFHWEHDRYVHAWHFPGPAAEPPRLRSIESDSHVAWPASPPLQQIHQQAFGDGREVVFGVGMAGRGHWSASFTLVPDLKCWIVELACRAAVTPELLLSSYRLSGIWEPLAGGGFMSSIGPAALQVEPIAPTAVASLSGDVLQVAPACPLDSAATLQWAFRLRVA